MPRTRRPRLESVLRRAAVISVTTLALGAGLASAEPVLLDDEAIVTQIPLLPQAGASEATPIPVGAFCPARPNDPMREASTFGASALLMWVLARRRVQRAGR